MPETPFLNLLTNGPHDLLYATAKDPGLDIADDTVLDVCLWTHAWHRRHKFAQSGGDPCRSPRPLTSSQIEAVSQKGTDINCIRDATTFVLVTQAYEVRRRHHKEFFQRLRDDGVKDALAWQAKRDGAASVLHAVLAGRVEEDNVLSWLSREPRALNTLYDLVEWLQQQQAGATALHLLLDQRSFRTGQTAAGVAAVFGNQDALLALYLWGASLEIFSYEEEEEEKKIEAAGKDNDDRSSYDIEGKNSDSSDAITTKGGGKTLSTTTTTTTLEPAPGGTPLMLAAKSGNACCVHVLLQAGATTRGTYDTWGRTARDVAAEATCTFATEAYRLRVAECAAILQQHMMEAHQITPTSSSVPPGPDPTRQNENRHPSEQRPATWALEHVVRFQRSKPKKKHSEKRLRIEQRERLEKALRRDPKAKGKQEQEQGLTGAPVHERGAAEMDRLSIRPDWGQCAPYSPRRKRPMVQPVGWMQPSSIDREIVLAAMQGDDDDDDDDVKRKKYNAGKERTLPLPTSNGMLEQHPVMLRARDVRQRDHDHLIDLFGHYGTWSSVAQHVRGRSTDKIDNTTAEKSRFTSSPACYTLGAPRGSHTNSDYSMGTIFHAAAHDGYAPSLSLLWSLHILHYSNLLADDGLLLETYDARGMTALHRAAASRCHSSTLPRKKGKKENGQKYQDKQDSSSTFRSSSASQQYNNNTEYDLRRTPASDHFLCLLQHGANVHALVTKSVSKPRTSSTSAAIPGDTVLHLAARRGDASVCALVAHVTDTDHPDASRRFRVARNSAGDTAADVAPPKSLAWLLVSQHEDSPVPTEFEIVQDYIRHRYSPPKAPTSAAACASKQDCPPASDRLIILQQLQTRHALSEQERVDAHQQYTMQEEKVRVEQAVVDKKLALETRKSTSQVLQQSERYKAKLAARFLATILVLDDGDLALHRRIGQHYNVMLEIEALEQDERDRLIKEFDVKQHCDHILSCVSTVQVEIMKKVNKANLMVLKRKYEEAEDGTVLQQERLVELEELQQWEEPEAYTPNARANSTNTLKRMRDDNEIRAARKVMVLNVLKREGARRGGVLAEAEEKEVMALKLLKAATVAARNGETWRRYGEERVELSRKWEEWGERHQGDTEVVSVLGVVEGKGGEGKEGKEGKESEVFKWYSSFDESESDEEMYM